MDFDSQLRPEANLASRQMKPPQNTSGENATTQLVDSSNGQTRQMISSFELGMQSPGCPEIEMQPDSDDRQEGEAFASQRDYSTCHPLNQGFCYLKLKP